MIGKINQLIKWEDREKFFDIENAEPHDLIVIGVNEKFNDSKLKRYLDSFKSKKETVDDFTLNHNISMWIKRPHDYKEGDIINLEITLEKIKETSTND